MQKALLKYTTNIRHVLLTNDWLSMIQVKNFEIYIFYTEKIV